MIDALPTPSGSAEIGPQPRKSTIYVIDDNFDVRQAEMWRVLQGMDDPENILINPRDEAQRYALTQWIMLQAIMGLKPRVNIAYERWGIEAPSAPGEATCGRARGGT